MVVSHIASRKPTEDSIDIADSSIMLLYKFLLHANIVEHIIVNTIIALCNIIIVIILSF